MGARWVRVQASTTALVLGAGVVSAVVGTRATGVTVAGPQTLSLIQRSAAALSSYPALALSVTARVSVGNHSQSIGEHGLMTPDGRSGTLTVDLPNGRGHLTLVADNSRMFALTPVSMLGQTDNKPWLELDVPASRAAAVTGTGSDPLAYLRLMPGATGQVRILGNDRIDGVRTTHYAVTIDLRRAIAAEPAQLRGDAESQLASQGLTTMPVEVWIDDAGGMRQTAFHLHLPAGDFSMTIRVAGSTTPVVVHVPHEQDIFHTVDLTQFSRLAAGLCC